MEKTEKSTLTILRILERDFGIHQEIALSNLSTPFFLSPFKMDAVSLAYLLLAIQDEASVVFPPESYDGYSLLSIESVSNFLGTYPASGATTSLS